MSHRVILAPILLLAALPVLAAVVPEAPPAVSPVPDPSRPLSAGKPETSLPAPPVTGSRGRMLYENHCTRCHASVLHVREDRRAVSLPVLEGWVRRWSGEEQLGWSEEEIVEVTDYLNRRYYRFPPPGGKK